MLTSQCNPNAMLGPCHSQEQSTKRVALEDLRCGHIEENKRSEPYPVGRLANTSFPLKIVSML